MKKLLWYVLKKLLFIAVIAAISISTYAQWKEPTIIYHETETTQALQGTAYTSEMAYEQSRQVGKLFGYENMWHFTYKLDQSPEFIKKTENEHWFSNSAKSIGKVFLGKEYSIDLRNYFMLGYDFSTLQPEDVHYIAENKTLVIQLPKLELSYTPDYAQTEFDSTVGLFRLRFSEEETHRMYEDSIQTGINRFITEETAVIQQGHDTTQEAIRKMLFALPELSKHIETIEFVQGSDEIVLSIEEYKKETTITNQ